MKLIAYNRKSTDESGHQVLSLDTQRRITDKIALDHGLDVVETIQEARSAKISGNRPLFTSILARIRDGEIQGIIVAHVDRLARNERELADILELFDQGLLKEIWNQDRVYRNYNDFHDIARDLVEAAHFSRVIVQKVKEGNESKRLKGEIVSRPPIGYIKVNGITVPDPVYAPFVKLAFALYSSGEYPLKALTKILNDRGMRTRINGNKMYKSTIADILRNPAYYGEFQSLGKVYKGIYEPLITRSQYFQVQEVLKGKLVPRIQKHDFMFRPVVRCAVCGCQMTATIKKGKYIYYYCTNAKGHCSEHKKYLTENEVYQLALSQFEPFTQVDSDTANLALETYIRDVRNNNVNLYQSKDQMEKRLLEIEKELNNLVKLLLKEKIDQTRYDALEKDMKAEKADIESKINNIKPLDPEETQKRLELTKEKALSIKTMFEDGDREVRSDLLKSVLWNFWIQGKNVASVRYKKPWEFIEKAAKSGDFETW